MHAAVVDRRSRRFRVSSTSLTLVGLLRASPLAASADSSNSAPQAQIDGMPTIRVDGGPLAGLTSNPLALTPTFDQNTTDYVWRCAAGTNALSVTLNAMPGHTIKVGQTRGSSVTISQNLVENQALVIVAANPTGHGGVQPDAGSNVWMQYWIRCLPHDFPELSVSRPGNPPPGWYLTGNLNSANGSGPYAMVLDNHGTPVWYRKPALPQPLNVTALSDGSLAWSALGTAFEDFNLQSRVTRFISAPVGATDFHELGQLPNGDLMMLSNPLKPDVDLSVLGLGSRATVFDCVLQEVNPAGGLVWQWRASDHISYAESTHPLPVDVAGQLTYDPFHCNSIDVDPTGGYVLMSARQTDAVYLVRKQTGVIIWKLGGNSITSGGAESIAITNDPQGQFHAQHDARFQPDSDISMYDNQSWNPALAARAVVYHIDATRGEASLIWAYVSPNHANSRATGSFRILEQGRDNVVGWGIKPNSLFTEVDNSGEVLLNVTFPDNESAYRVIKVSPATLDHSLLRFRAGLPPFVLTHSPAIWYVSPAGGPESGGEVVTITGTGFSGATTVSFGSTPATSFQVLSDAQIVATVPAGTGTVSIAVTGPGGTSPATAINQLSRSTSDSGFEDGSGSWVNNVNSVLAGSTDYAFDGTHSLQVAPQAPGFMSALSGRYAVLPGASVSGSAEVTTPGAAHQVRAFLIFYDRSGNVIAIDQSAFGASSPSGWTLFSLTGVAPPLAAAAAVGIDDASASSAIYVDGAVLAGSDQFTYR